MYSLTKERIRNNIADSLVIFKRGEKIFNLGDFYQKEADFEKQSFKYYIEGNYGDYDITVDFNNGRIKYYCSCPYYNDGCKHTVAVCLDIVEHVSRYKAIQEGTDLTDSFASDDTLEYDEIKKQAMEDRRKKARSEEFEITLGETYKGEHLITNVRGKEYVVTIHDPEQDTGHCKCPDFNTNKLNTCKHLIYLYSFLKTQEDFHSRIKEEKAPFVHFIWSAILGRPIYFYDKKLPKKVVNEIEPYFDDKGIYSKNDIADMYPLLDKLRCVKNVRIDSHVIQKIDESLLQKEIEKSKKEIKIDYSVVTADLYPYQKEGIDFALFKKSAIIADEMGLGKTIQAIALALLKKDIFRLEKTLIICPASLKEQWKREIERFSNEQGLVISGPKDKRQEAYEKDNNFFKITNYEAVLRDNLVINRYKPDLIILDEAQRIKNFETKTAQCIKSIPHKQSIVISGTPLVNKLEDLYSIVQFSDTELFSPLWEFAAEHFILKKDKKNKIFGYKNLDCIHDRLKPLVIRRKKEDVLKDLPEQVSNNYYIELCEEQLEMHQGYVSSLLPILNKKFHTPIDVRRIQQLLTSMRMVCDSTFLIDRKTNLSPKLKELKEVLKDLVVENRRKTVIFSEWTTMTFLIGKLLSELKIPFVEFTGKIPVQKRQAIINEFNQNEECLVFLSTDAGGVGLNLQTADCVINFELPWNPAKLNQRIGRVMRIGQKSKCVNVVNFIAKNSIEEKIHAGIKLKQELFDGVFEGTTDMVEFSREKKEELINKIREMLNEKEIAMGREASDPEEIPDSTPHFLNPKALGDEVESAEEQELDIAGEEAIDSTDNKTDSSPDIANKNISDDKQTSTKPETTPEKMEEVLDNGMKFLSGLMVMATGKALIPEDQKKTITVDKETGEVTMKFKLPGF